MAYLKNLNGADFENARSFSWSSDFSKIFETAIVFVAIKNGSMHLLVQTTQLQLQIYGMKKHTRHISKMIRLYVNEIDPKAKVVLYGSQARGDERSDSDGNVLVLMDHPVDQEIESKFRYILYALNC